MGNSNSSTKSVVCHRKVGDICTFIGTNDVRHKCKIIDVEDMDVKVEFVYIPGATLWTPVTDARLTNFTEHQPRPEPEPVGKRACGCGLDVPCHCNVTDVEINPFFDADMEEALRESAETEKNTNDKEADIEGLVMNTRTNNLNPLIEALFKSDESDERKNLAPQFSAVF